MCFSTQFFPLNLILKSKMIQGDIQKSCFVSLDLRPFKYYVIKEVGGWGQKMAILDDLQYCKSSKSWVGGPKKVKNMMT